MAGDDDVCSLKEIPIENELWLTYLNTPGTYLPQTVGAPACELFSVGVCRNSKYFQQHDVFQIYGTITLYDVDGTSYELYCRAFGDSQTLTPEHNLLSLDMSVDCLISTTWSHMVLNLMDKADDAVVVKQCLNFDKLTDINQCNKVELADNSVFVTYAAFRAAVVAILKITLIKTNDSSPVNLSGKIIARCGNTYGHKYPGIVLLNSPSFEAISNVPILLSRDVVVVPAHSFLRIDLHLSQLDPHQQEDITCQADFLAKHLSNHNDDIVTKDFVVRFKVHWRHPYALKDNSRQLFEHHKISNVPQRHPFRRESAYSLLDVYGVMIHHDTDSELKICGTMKICDNFTKFILFDRNEMNPVKISRNDGTIPIVVQRRCFNMSPDYLYMALMLKDVEGQVLIEGEIFWNESHVKKPMSWYDKRICSVIRGVRGYAEVFYTIFSKAEQAQVTITFCGEYGYVGMGFIYCVDGSVVARHSNETYLTEHDKTYYQSVLFRGNSSNVQSGFTLPLSKSVVAVPIGASLTIAVDLYVKPLSLGHSQEHLESEVSFNLGSKILQIIKHERCSILVSVEWSDLDKLIYEEIKDAYEEGF
ncbi:uncharacterized protein LOC141642573 [Silene latifolia]|uniref:uncharacterized protein LOC141642572 n=1 Tax=Silene latifolia TaxID=37657 RepID=UPI003D76EA66